MTLAIIGALALLAGAGAGFLPGVVLAVGLIVLGLLLDFAPWRYP